MTKLCPSAPYEEDALLIGIVQPDATVAIAARAIPVSREFVETASAGRKPEMRFRFAGACMEGNCAQWKKGQMRNSRSGAQVADRS
jgi:hypothetical protein